VTMDYIREHYNKEFRRGARVRVRWYGKLYEATIVGSSYAYLRVRLHPLHKPLLFHPNNIELILPDEPEQAAQP
jgi:hypothetical protein